MFDLRMNLFCVYDHDLIPIYEFYHILHADSSLMLATPVFRDSCKP